VVGLKKKVELVETDIGTTKMFLCDYAEFGRKVRVVSKGLPSDKVRIADPKSSIYKDGYLGGLTYKTISGSERGVLPTYKSAPSVFDRPLVEKRILADGDVVGMRKKGTSWDYEKIRQNPRSKTKKPLRKPKQTTTSSTQTVNKSSRKLLNKYTLGGLGVLGGAAATYGGYKLLTRNKNKKEK
jgi:hypothetical protein